MKKPILKMLKNFSPLLTNGEAEFLLNAAKYIQKNGVIVEIGTYKGASAFLLAKGSMENNKGKIYTIDSDVSNLKYLVENIKKAKMEERIIPITKTSEQAAKNWKKPVSLLFIDGNHDYPFVKRDFLLWEKYLVKGGIIAFHDSRRSNNNIMFTNSKHEYYNGPKRVVKEDILGSNRFKNIKVLDSITYAQKIRNMSSLESLEKLFFSLKYQIEKFSEKTDRIIGKIGILLKKHHTQLYVQLKKFQKMNEEIER